MKRQIVAAGVLSLVFSVSALAAEGSRPAAVPDFEKMKAAHLKRIEDRIKGLQEERLCVQSAQDKDNLDTCRLKYRVEMKKRREMGKGRGPGDVSGHSPSEIK